MSQLMDRERTAKTEDEAPKIAMGEAILCYGLTHDERHGRRGLQHTLEPLGQSSNKEWMLLRSEVVGVLKKRSNENARVIEAKEQKRTMFIAAMGRWKPVKPPEFHDSGTPLPPDLWRRILDQLIPDIKSHCIRGVRAAARDISNVRMVCKELYAIGEPAFKQLSLRCPAPHHEALWNRFLIEPRALCLQEIKALARQLDIPFLADPIWADKPTLTRKIFEQLRISQPTGIPAAVLLAVNKARGEPKWCLHSYIDAVLDGSKIEEFGRLCILAHMRSKVGLLPSLELRDNALSAAILQEVTERTRQETSQEIILRD